MGNKVVIAKNLRRCSKEGSSPPKGDCAKLVRFVHVCARWESQGYPLAPTRRDYLATEASALDREVPNEVANVKAVAGLQPRPVYQAGE